MNRSAILVIGLLFSMQAFAETRDWTDVQGRVIKAEMVSSDASSVTLKLNGQNVVVPLEKLSANDRDWIKQQATPTPSMSAPTAASTSGELTIAGQKVKPGAKIEFETPLTDELKARRAKLTRGAKEYDDASFDKAQVGLFVPEKFDPAKTWPVMIVSVTNSGRDKGKVPSSVKAMGAFLDAARSAGWVVIAADCPGYAGPGLPYNRCALAEAALDALATAWPASKNWPVATGGFSGGAKYTGWLGGWFADRERTVVGMFMAGVNEDMAAVALKELKPNRKRFTSAKVFISTGMEDKIAGPEKTTSVMKSLKGNGFTVREEKHSGGHEVNKDHILSALKWFMGTEGS